MSYMIVHQFMTGAVKLDGFYHDVQVAAAVYERPMMKDEVSRILTVVHVGYVKGLHGIALGAEL